MQKTFHSVHQHEYSKSNYDEDVESSKYHEETITLDTSSDCHTEKDLCKLTVGQGESPKTKVTCCVGYSAQDKFDNLDCLMDEDLSRFNIILIFSIVLLLTDRITVTFLPDLLRFNNNIILHINRLTLN